MCVKDVKYMYYVKNKTCFGCFTVEENKTKDNEIGLKEGKVIKIEIYSVFHIRDARSLSLLYFTYRFHWAMHGTSTLRTLN